MKRFYLVRHGESEGNVTHIVGGKELKLTEAGHQQAAQLAERVSHLEVQKLISSDFVRAQETIKPISEVMRSEVEVMPVFGEKMAPSSFYGLPDDDPQVLAYIKVGNEKMTDPTHRFEDGENFFDIHARVNEARTFLENCDLESVLVVSHSFFSSYFSASLLLDAREPAREVLELTLRLKLSNTGITYFQFEDGKWKLMIWNDHAHFAE